MKSAGERVSAKGWRVAPAAFVCAMALSACTSARAPDLQIALPGNGGTVPAASIAGMMADVAASESPALTSPDAASAPVAGQPPADGTPAPSDPQRAASPQGIIGQTALVTVSTPPAAAPLVDGAGLILPDQVAYVPTANPALLSALGGPAPQSPALEAIATAAPLDPPADDIADAVPLPTPSPAALDSDLRAAATAPAGDAAAARPVAVSMPAVPAPKKRGFLALLFGSAGATAPVKSAPARPLVPQPSDALETGSSPKPLIGEAAQPLIDRNAAPKPVLQLASAERPVHASLVPHGPYDALPGVRQNGSLFEITRKSAGDNSDVDINEDAETPVEIASAAGMARVDPNGLLLQRETVDTACLKPALLTVLKEIEAHFGRRMIVTSGYRTPVHNAAAHGARNSLHMFCAAADVQVPGISKWELASYARSMPGRGGVGTYCHTKSVHIDIGPERDWNWRCSRRHRRH